MRSKVNLLMLQQSLHGHIVREGSASHTNRVGIQLLDSCSLVERSRKPRQTFDGQVADRAQKQVGRGDRSTKAKELERRSGRKIGDCIAVDDKRAR